MNMLSLYAQALQYPYPGQVEAIQTQISAQADATGLKEFHTFLQKIGALSLSDQEELFTRSLDLDPLAAPYVGYQVWGESYKRGEFMSALSREMAIHGIDLGGELPDHLRPVLLYLAATTAPLPELLETIGPALETMQKALKKNEADNPYLHLLAAIKQACTQLTKSLPVGG